MCNRDKLPNRQQMIQSACMPRFGNRKYYFSWQISKKSMDISLKCVYNQGVKMGGICA